MRHLLAALLVLLFVVALLIGPALHWLGVS